MPGGERKSGCAAGRVRDGSVLHHHSAFIISHFFRVRRNGGERQFFENLTADGARNEGDVDLEDHTVSERDTLQIHPETARAVGSGGVFTPTT